MQELSLALIQTDLFWEQPSRNLLRFRDLMGMITGAADMIVLPETFSTGFTTNPVRCAEEMDGPSVTFMKEMAADKNAVVIGSLLILEENKFYNRCISAFPDGEMIWYDKKHLFRMSDEFRYFTGGRDKKIIGCGEWKIQPMVCYDLRFPVWTRNTFSDGKYGYDLLIFVANWPESRKEVWRSLLVARAIENQAYVVGVNRIGKDGDGTDHAGDSMVIDPKGKIILDAGRDAGVFQIRLDLESLGQFRRSFPVAHDWDNFRIENQ
jgi:predicted amidohydrolase